MASPNRPAPLNRTLLGIVAILLLAVAAFTLLTGFGVLTVLDGDAALTPSTLTLPSWATYLEIVLAVLAGLLLLRWLLAQTQRKPKTGTWRLEADPARGTTSLDAQTAVDPLVDEVESYPGVHRASARLAGTAARPVLHLVIGTESAADITALRRRISGEAIPRLRGALELQHLPADLLIRLDDAPSARLT